MTTDTVNAVALVLFVVGLLVSVGSTAVRMLNLRRAGHVLPYLIWRDLAVFGLLALPFLSIAMARVFDWPVAGNLWWSLFTAGSAVASVAVYVYYELRVIGHRRERR